MTTDITKNRRASGLGEFASAVGDVYASSGDPFNQWKMSVVRNGQISDNKFEKAYGFALDPSKEVQLVGQAHGKIRTTMTGKDMEVAFGHWINSIYPGAADNGVYNATGVKDQLISLPEFQNLKAKWLSKNMSMAETTMLKGLSEPGLKLTQKLMGGAFSGRTQKKMARRARKYKKKGYGKF